MNDVKTLNCSFLMPSCSKRRVVTGDPDAAKRRLEVLDGIPVLSPQPKVDEIALSLIDRLNLPDRALTDAAHIAISIVHGIDYLLTWNCAHIANAMYQPVIHEVCDAFGLSMPCYLHS